MNHDVSDTIYTIVIAVVGGSLLGVVLWLMFT